MLDLIRRDGFHVVRGIFSEELMLRVGAELDGALRDYAALHRATGYVGADQGGAHHVLSRGGSFLDLLDALPMDTLAAFLGSRCIINSYGGFDNVTGRKLYVANIHRDIRFYFSSRPLMVNILVMLDDFTEENGATYLLPGSHLVAEKPAEDDFYRAATRATGSRGDLLIFDSRLWHAAGDNQTGRQRRALTLTLTPPFLKPQFDYCRALGYERCADLSEQQKQLVGWHSRIPATIEEWYQPPGSQFYRKDQDHVSEL